MKWRLHLAILIGLVVRLPFWIEAMRTPVDGDTAIVGLMARQAGQRLPRAGHLTAQYAGSDQREQRFG